jgi:MATE family multidrug resistance protein
VNAGAGLGDAEAAGNQVLLQFIAVSAFVLDAFAFIAEKETGEAVGARDRARLDRAMRRTSELALGFGVLFSLGFLLLGGPVIRAFIADPAARAVALHFLPWCAAVPVLGVPAWQLDGIFLGATRGRALRNAAVVATALYIGLDLLLADLGNTGVWWAFLGMYLLRAAALLPGLPGLRRAVAGGATG